jgi:hypothetical protein
MGQRIEVYSRPAVVRVDNRPELTAQSFMDWCEHQAAEPRCIQSGKPDKNVCIEQSNRSCREEVLSAYVFRPLERVRALGVHEFAALDEVLAVLQAWRGACNHRRPQWVTRPPCPEWVRGERSEGRLRGAGALVTSCSKNGLASAGVTLWTAWLLNGGGASHCDYTGYPRGSQMAAKLPP